MVHKSPLPKDLIGKKIKKVSFTKHLHGLVLELEDDLYVQVQDGQIIKNVFIEEVKHSDCLITEIMESMLYFSKIIVKKCKRCKSLATQFVDNWGHKSFCRKCDLD